MATVDECRNRAANDLGLLRLGQALPAHDNTRLQQAYDEIYAQLRKKGLATWASTGEVPDELVPHLVALMAFSCTGTYGVSPDRYSRIAVAAAGAEREIRLLVADTYVSLDDPEDF